MGDEHPGEWEQRSKGLEWGAEGPHKLSHNRAPTQGPEPLRARGEVGPGTVLGGLSLDGESVPVKECGLWRGGSRGGL